jgi:hypothetical protein
MQRTTLLSRVTPKDGSCDYHHNHTRIASIVGVEQDTSVKTGKQEALTLVSCSAYSIFKMDAICSAETSVD